MRKDEIEETVKEGAELMARQNYGGALKRFNEVLEHDPDHLYATYGKTFCLATFRNGEVDPTRKSELEREVWTWGEKLVELTPEASLWPYLEEHLFPRETLRFAYNCFAWYTYEGAETEEELERAMQYIDHCLSLRSPIDKDESLYPYEDTKVRILLKQNKIDEAYRIVQKTLKMAPHFRDFQDIKGSREYKEWISEGGLSEFLTDRVGETAYEALMRLQAYIEQFDHDYYESLSFSAPVPPEEIEQVETKLGKPLPPSYVKFVTTHGLLCISDSYYEMPSPREALEDTLEIWDLYSEEADSNDEFEADLAVIKKLFFFQNNPYASDHYAFNLEDVRGDGEMSVHRYYHDDAMYLNKEFIDFTTHIVELVNAIIQEDNE